jgi:integrase
MPSSVTVVPARDVDTDVLARLLGEPILRIPHVSSPSIMADGRFHTAACHWLLRKHQQRPVTETTTAHARRLASWIDYLRNTRHRVHPDERHSDVFVATEDDLDAYYTARQYDPKTQVASATWKAQRSTIKQFHQFLNRSYGIPMPFDVHRVTLPSGQTVEALTGLTARRRTGSRGTPITPGFAELLLQAALRIDRHGRQRDTRTVDRDAAFISLGLGTGMRRGTLTHISVYEIPTPSSAPFTSIRIPDFITKGDAGGDALAFSHRLGHVHNYLTGHRAEIIQDGRPYRPQQPLPLVHADSDTWTAEVEGKLVRRDWAETDAATRRRLVDIDGSSPLVWLDPRTADPVGYDTCGRITELAREWAREHLLPDFPARFRTHDLRHTYATHLTVCIFKRAVAAYIHPDSSDAYSVTRIKDAVELAKMSLGHTSEESTALYTQHAHKFLDISLDEFLGRH